MYSTRLRRRERCDTIFFESACLFSVQCSFPSHLTVASGTREPQHSYDKHASNTARFCSHCTHHITPPSLRSATAHTPPLTPLPLRTRCVVNAVLCARRGHGGSQNAVSGCRCRLNSAVHLSSDSITHHHVVTLHTVKDWFAASSARACVRPCTVSTACQRVRVNVVPLSVDRVPPLSIKYRHRPSAVCPLSHSLTRSLLSTRFRCITITFLSHSSYPVPCGTEFAALTVERAVVRELDRRRGGLSDRTIVSAECASQDELCPPPAAQREAEKEYYPSLPSSVHIQPCTTLSGSPTLFFVPH